MNKAHPRLQEMLLKGRLEGGQQGNKHVPKHRRLLFWETSDISKRPPFEKQNGIKHASALAKKVRGMLDMAILK